MSAPANARSGDSGGRTYVWPATGENFHSVTTILRALNKPGLMYWSARTVAEGAIAHHDEWRAILADEGTDAAVRFLKGLPWDKRDKAADAGSTVHAAIEAEVKGTTPPDWPNALAGFRVQWQRFLEAYRPEWVASEATVYSRKYGYAGTLDWIARIGGVTYLGDLKTGERIYDEVALQLAAYRFADWIDIGDGVEHPVPATDAVAVLHLRPNAYYLRHVTADEATHRSFLHILQAFRWQQQVAAVSPVGAMVMPVNLTPEGAAA